MLRDLVLRNRSYRRFDQTCRIPSETLRGLIDLARLTPSSRNAQPLKYILVSSPDACEKVFPQLSWAGYLKDWPGPVEGERPTAYVIVLGDSKVANNFSIDPGISAQTLLLGAVELGLGGCILASVKRDEVRSLLEIPQQYEILYVIALGKPLEKVAIEPIGADGDIKYWRDEQQVHHVPKRSLEEVVISEK